MWLSLALFALFELFATPVSAGVQDNAPGAQQPENYFTGVITALSKEQITVDRTILGQPSGTRTFRITAETKFEGRPRVKSRVTVRFAPADGGEGEKAVHIIVRTAAKK